VNTSRLPSLNQQLAAIAIVFDFVNPALVLWGLIKLKMDRLRAIKSIRNAKKALGVKSIRVKNAWLWHLPSSSGHSAPRNILHVVFADAAFNRRKCPSQQSQRNP
jgi:hypothetical protein